MNSEQKEKLWELIDELLDAEFLLERSDGDPNWKQALEDSKQHRINLQNYIKEL